MSDMKPEHRMVVCNCPPGMAKEIAGVLVREKLAACVNVLPGVESVYEWKGELCDDRESTLLIKTRSDLMEALTKRIGELHPYEVPEVIALRLVPGEGNPAYFSWLDEVTR